MLRAEGNCACVAHMARAKIRGRGWPSPSQKSEALGGGVHSENTQRGRHLNILAYEPTLGDPIIPDARTCNAAVIRYGIK
jgi:hypothetical protein